MNDWHWLGHPPAGTAKQEYSNLDKIDLLSKAVRKWTLDKGFEAKHNGSGKLFSVDVQKIPVGILADKMGLVCTSHG